MKGLELDLLQGCNQSIKGSSKNEKYESEMAISDKFESIDVIFFEAKQIQVYNMNGVLIYNALISKDQTTLNINTQKWNGGIYIIKTIDNNDKIQSKKYLKM
jgi:glutathione peroxidase-family protein